MKQWFVVHTQALKETLAQQHLKDQNFEVYLPCYKKIRRHARKIDEVSAPLFPRYLFIAIDLETDQWRSVLGTRGVSCLLMINGRPAVIPTAIIQSLKEQETNDGFVPIQSIASFEKGDRVRIMDGAFKEYVAIFEKMDDKQRVQLLLDCLGRQVAVSLPLGAVEAA